MIAHLAIWFVVTGVGVALGVALGGMLAAVIRLALGARWASRIGSRPRRSESRDAR